jgi:hypothetical protein
MLQPAPRGDARAGKASKNERTPTLTSSSRAAENRSGSRGVAALVSKVSSPLSGFHDSVTSAPSVSGQASSPARTTLGGRLHKETKRTSLDGSADPDFLRSSETCLCSPERMARTYVDRQPGPSADRPTARPRARARAIPGSSDRSARAAPLGHLSGSSARENSDSSAPFVHESVSASPALARQEINGVHGAGFSSRASPGGST